METVQINFYEAKKDYQKCMIVSLILYLAFSGIVIGIYSYLQTPISDTDALSGRNVLPLSKALLFTFVIFGIGIGLLLGLRLCSQFHRYLNEINEDEYEDLDQLIISSKDKELLRASVKELMAAQGKIYKYQYQYIKYEGYKTLEDSRNKLLNSLN